MKSKFAVALVLMLGWLGQGCSTPASYGQTAGDYELMREEAWSAYNSCLQALGAYGRAYECDNVNSGSGSSRNQNSGYGSGYVYGQPAQYQTPQQYYGNQTPPPYYVWSAEPSEVDAMKEQWLALAEEPEKAL